MKISLKETDNVSKRLYPNKEYTYFCAHCRKEDIADTPKKKVCYDCRQKRIKQAWKRQKRRLLDEK